MNVHMYWVCNVHVYLLQCTQPYHMRPWDFRWRFSSTCTEPQNVVVRTHTQVHKILNLEIRVGVHVCYIKKRHRCHFITFAVVHFNSFLFKKQYFFIIHNTIMIFFLEILRRNPLSKFQHKSISLQTIARVKRELNVTCFTKYLKICERCACFFCAYLHGMYDFTRLT